MIGSKPGAFYVNTYIVMLKGIVDGNYRVEMYIVHLFCFSFCQPGQGHQSRVTRAAYANYCGPFYLTHPVNFPSGRKPEYPEEVHNFRQSVDYHSFRVRTGFQSH
jgi:hypothetical protein